MLSSETSKLVQHYHQVKDSINIIPLEFGKLLLGIGRRILRPRAAILPGFLAVVMGLKRKFAPRKAEQEEEGEEVGEGQERRATIPAGFPPRSILSPACQEAPWLGGHSSSVQ